MSALIAPSANHGELAWWLALLRAPGVGAATYLALIDRHGTPAKLFQEGTLLTDLPGPTRDYLRQPNWAGVEQDLKWADEAGNAILTWHDPLYPALLREIADPPPLLFVRGTPTLLSNPQLAIVGSRNPTPLGTETARDFARHLASQGLTITSGMALGIDAASHQGALAAGGHTIAVAGTGLDRVYPARHRDMAHEIAMHGALVSELPTGTPALAENFPRRNRIISGLSLGVLVVEAALRSGSLITARMANEQGREVFAIPGSIHNPLARGCHALLRQGAKLVESAQDVLEELGPLATYATAHSTGHITSGLDTLDMTPEQAQLLDRLGYEPTTVDTLINRSGLTAEAVSSMLLVLELQGHIASAPGGGYMRLPRHRL